MTVVIFFILIFLQCNCCLALFQYEISFSFCELDTKFLDIFGIAILCTIIPMTLVLGSLQKLKKTEVALLSMIEPLTATLASWVLLKEGLTVLQMIGGFLILAGLALRFRNSSTSNSV